MDSPLFLEDIQRISNSISNYEQYRNSTFFITGGTGFIGSVITKSLLYLNEQKNLNLTLILYIRSTEKLKEVYPHTPSCIHVITGDFSSPIHCTEPVDYIFHCASITDSKTMVTQPVETISTTFQSTSYVLELAREKQIKSMVYLSSMEVYGSVSSSLRCTESDLGSIDILNIRSSYSEGKRAAECLCKCYAQEYHVPVKIARLAQTFGPGVPPSDNRIFAQFSKSVISNTDIVLHTTGQSMGNYCYTTDSVSAIFLLLSMGDEGEAYNVVNEKTTTTICGMAQMVAHEIAHDQIKVIFDLPKDAAQLGYAPPTQLSLSSKKLNALGWSASFELKDMYIRTIEYFRSFL